MSERRLSVVGKGNKRRVVAYGAKTARALWAYARDAAPERILFEGERGPLTRSGLQQVMTKLGLAAGVRDVHPHRLRHSFAIEFLRQGGNVFTLQAILGHTHLQMTQRYVAIAQADVVVQQRKHAPGDRL
jgi:site-specific recombinase XerD